GKECEPDHTCPAAHRVVPGDVTCVPYRDEYFPIPFPGWRGPAARVVRLVHPDLAAARGAPEHPGPLLFGDALGLRHVHRWLEHDREAVRPAGSVLGACKVEQDRS